MPKFADFLIDFICLLLSIRFLKYYLTVISKVDYTTMTLKVLLTAYHIYAKSCLYLEKNLKFKYMGQNMST